MSGRTLVSSLLLVCFSYAEAHQDALTYRDRLNRWEGRRQVDAAAPDLDLLSFTRYLEPFSNSANVTLRLKFYLPRNAEAHVTARELIVRDFYHMNVTRTDWGAGWQEFSAWPTSDVLKPLKLGSDDLGMVARIGVKDTRSGEVAPLIVYHSSHPRRLGAYAVYAKPREDLRTMDYRVAEVGGKTAAAQGSLTKLLGGVPFLITFDLSASAGAVFELTLNGRYERRAGGPRRTYTFFHARDIP